jgi:hypothetical protein
MLAHTHTLAHACRHALTSWLPSAHSRASRARTPPPPRGSAATRRAQPPAAVTPAKRHVATAVTPAKRHVATAGGVHRRNQRCAGGHVAARRTDVAVSPAGLHACMHGYNRPPLHAWMEASIHASIHPISIASGHPAHALATTRTSSGATRCALAHSARINASASPTGSGRARSTAMAVPTAKSLFMSPARACGRVGAEGCSSHGRTRAHAVSSLHWHAFAHTREFRPRPRGRTKTRAHSPAHEHTRQRTHSAVWPRQRERARAQRSRTLASHTLRRHTRCDPDGPVPSARAGQLPCLPARCASVRFDGFGGRKFPARRRRRAVTSDDDVLGAPLARDVHARREL